MVKPNNLRKVSIARLKQEMQDTVFLSDDLAITTIDYLRNPTSEIPVSLDGFAAMIMMSGSAVLSIDTETYEVRPNMLVFFRPGSIIRTIRCSSDATAYLVACSKAFVSDIQVDISASLPIHMRFEPAPRAASGVKKWIASSEGFAKGILRIDQGAAAAVRASKAASILAVGVTAVEGDFERDDLVRILSPDGAQLAVGRISCDSATARRNIGRKGLKPLVHCDYLYLE